MATETQHKAVLAAINTVMRLDPARSAQRLDELDLKRLQDAENLLGGMPGSRLLTGLLEWNRSCLGRGEM